MNIESIEKKILNYNEAIKNTSNSIQEMTQKLQIENQKLFVLHGHLNECIQWKQEFYADQNKINEIKNEE